MKQIYFMLALLATVLFTVNLNNASPVNDVQETITGTVEGVSWDDNDNVTEVAIAVVIETVDNEGEPEDIVDYYYVNNSKGKGKELLKHVNAEVEVTGIVKTIENEEENYKKITVTAYKILKSAPVEPKEDVEPEEDEEPEE